MGAAAHRPIYIWSNAVPTQLIQEATPKELKPEVSLRQILVPYHEPSIPGYTDFLPQALQNKAKSGTAISVVIKSGVLMPPGKGNAVNYGGAMRM